MGYSAHKKQGDYSEGENNGFGWRLGLKIWAKRSSARYLTTKILHRVGIVGSHKTFGKALNPSPPLEKKIAMSPNIQFVQNMNTILFVDFERVSISQHHFANLDKVFSIYNEKI